MEVSYVKYDLNHWLPVVIDFRQDDAPDLRCPIYKALHAECITAPAVELQSSSGPCVLVLKKPFSLGYSMTDSTGAQPPSHISSTSPATIHHSTAPRDPHSQVLPSGAQGKSDYDKKTRSISHMHFKDQKTRRQRNKDPTFIILNKQSLIGEQMLSIVYCHQGSQISNKKSMGESNITLVVHKDAPRVRPIL